MYGIDLISFVNGEFNILLSVEDVTDNWVPLCRFVRWVNIIDVPPMRFHEVLDVFNDKITDDDPVQNGSESDFSNQGNREYITYRMGEKSLWGYPFRLDKSVLDKNVIDKICRILECQPEELHLPEER